MELYNDLRHHTAQNILAFKSAFWCQKQKTNKHKPYLYEYKWLFEYIANCSWGDP